MERPCESSGMFVHVCVCAGHHIPVVAEKLEKMEEMIVTVHNIASG